MDSDMQLFRDWNIELDADALKSGHLMSPVRKPLWKVVKRKLSREEKRTLRREKAALQSEDKARNEVKVGLPGSKERIAAYAEFYARNELLMQSAFE